MTSKVRVNDAVFKTEPNDDVVYRAVVSEMTAARQGTRSTKTRAEVRGGGRKPWRQKGRGVARAGSTRSPLWKGGGVVFGPKGSLYRNRLPKKMRRLARRSVLSQRAGDKEIIVVDHLTVDGPKTKSFVRILSNLGIEGKKVTFLPGDVDTNIILASRNLSHVMVVPAQQASTYDLLNCEVLLFDKEGIKQLNRQLGAN
ncbi:MAG: 50S ribosomal protein L4 [Fidelibacterota bacterium]